MRELGRESWRLVGLEVNVARGDVELDSSERGNGSNLRIDIEIS